VSPVLDVLGAEVAIPDAEAIAGLASHYLQVRDQIGEVRSQLKGADNDTAWQGEAADAFRQDLGALPSELTRAYTSYGDMAGTLSGYADAVRDWVSQYRSLAQQANDVSYELEQTQSALHQASASGADTSSLQGRVASLISELSSLQNRLNFLLNTVLPGLANACVQGIQQAENAGISNSVWVGLGDLAGDVGGFLDDVVVKPFEDLPGDVVAVIEHPGSLQDWSRLLGDLSSCVGILSLAVPGLGEAILPETLALDAAHFGVDTAIVAGGGKGRNALDLVFDGVAVAGDGAGIFSTGAGEGDKAVQSLEQESKGAFSDAADAAARGDEQAAAALDQKGIDNELAAGTLSQGQTALSLGKQGLEQVINPKKWFSADAWSDTISSIRNPISESIPNLLRDYTTLGVSDLSSPAAVIVHRVSTAVGWTAATAGDAYSGATSQPRGG
jgi:hypothetical protein